MKAASNAGSTLDSSLFESGWSDDEDNSTSLASHGYYSQQSPLFLTAQTAYFQTNTTYFSSSQPPVSVAGSCMFCPVLIAFWWYYTRKCCSRMQRFIRSSPEPVNHERFDDKFSRFGDGPYSKWQEILEDQNDSMTRRVVKWLKRKSIRQTYQEHGIKKATQKLMLELGNDSRDTNDSCDSGWECIAEVPAMPIC